MSCGTSYQGRPILFPQELIDMITDHLADSEDVAVLIACSTASRSWLSAARRHLFHTLRVSGSSGRDEFARFSGFLQQAPYICRHIRALQLYHKHGRSSRPRLTMARLYAILDQLPRLHTLKLKTLDFVPSPGLSHLPYEVKHLTMENLNIHHNAWDAFLALGHSGVTHLRLGPFAPQWPTEYLSNPPQMPFLNLQELTLSDATQNLFHFASHAVSAFNTLRCVLKPGAISLLGAVLTLRGHSMSRFEFEFQGRGWDNATDWGSLNLGQCSALQTAVAYYSPFDPSWDLRFHIIAALPVTLRELVLEVIGYEDLANLPCWKLEEMLQRFTQLQRVVFWTTSRATGFVRCTGENEPVPARLHPDNLRSKLQFVLPTLSRKRLLFWQVDTWVTAPSDG